MKHVTFTRSGESDTRKSCSYSLGQDYIVRAFEVFSISEIIGVVLHENTSLIFSKQTLGCLKTTQQKSKYVVLTFDSELSESVSYHAQLK